MTHLWEAEHPYYAAEGNYYASGHHAVFDSVESFIADEGPADIDMNLVYRWDWQPFDREPEDPAEYDTLSIYFIGQRKAKARSAEVRIDPKDRERVEPMVRAYLAPRLARLLEIWAPMVPLLDAKEGGG